MRVKEKLELALRKAMICDGVFIVNENFVIQSYGNVVRAFIYGKNSLEFNREKNKCVVTVFYLLGAITPTFKKYLNYVLEFFNLGGIRIKNGELVNELKSNVELIYGC